MKNVRKSMLFTLTLVTLALTAESALAGITAFDSYGTIDYNQTGASTSSLGSFYASRIFTSSATDIASASLVTGASSGMGGVSGTYVANQVGSSFDPSAPAFTYQTAFLPGSGASPLAPYMSNGTTFQLSATPTGSNNAQSSTTNYGPELFAAAVPLLSTASYNSLQSIDARTADTINFNNFAAASGASASNIFVTIYNVENGSIAYQSGPLSSSSSSITLAANTLSNAEGYKLVIDFTNTVVTQALNVVGSTLFNDNANYTVGYTVQTEVNFVTLPEPSSLVLTAVGAASAVFAARRRRAKSSR